MVPVDGHGHGCRYGHCGPCVLDPSPSPLPVAAGGTRRRPAGWLRINRQVPNAGEWWSIPLLCRTARRRPDGPTPWTRGPTGAWHVLPCFRVGPAPRCCQETGPASIGPLGRPGARPAAGLGAPRTRTRTRARCRPLKETGPSAVAKRRRQAPSPSAVAKRRRLGDVRVDADAILVNDMAEINLRRGV
jgi:hypothetical protein